MSNAASVDIVKPEPQCSGLARQLIIKIGFAINWSGAAITIATLSFMFFAILCNVILRYFFDSGITWAYEIPAILFPWTVAGGVVMATAQGRHIAVEAITIALPERLRWLLAIAINLFTCATSVGVVYYSLPIVKASQWSRLAETGIPQIYGYSSMIYAFSMVAILCLLTTLEFLMGRRAKVVDPTETNYS